MIAQLLTRHRRSKTAAALVATLLLAAPPALAWNAAGHRLSAAIAWRSMAPATRSELARLLADHPDYRRWVAKAAPGQAAYQAFLAASTWPDDIKRDRRFHEDREKPTAKLRGFPDMARHRRWHYADHDLESGARLGRGELDVQLVRLRDVLADRRQPRHDRAYALSWVVHLVGDAHQPLHLISRRDAEAHDAGGNDVWVRPPLGKKRRSISLHAYWDGLAGSAALRGKALEARADALLTSAPPRAAGGAAPGLGNLTVAAWAVEARQLAQRLVYAGIDRFSAEIDLAYQQRAERAAEERITLAGQRLAELLDTALTGGAVSRGTTVSRETRSSPAGTLRIDIHRRSPVAD